MRIAIKNKISSVCHNIWEHTVFAKSKTFPQSRATECLPYRHLLSKKIRHDEKAKACKNESLVGAIATASIVGAFIGIPHLIACAIGYEYHKYKSYQCDKKLVALSPTGNQYNSKMTLPQQQKFTKLLHIIKNCCYIIKDKHIAKGSWDRVQLAINKASNGDPSALWNMTNIAIHIEHRIQMEQRERKTLFKYKPHTIDEHGDVKENFQ